MPSNHRQASHLDPLEPRRLLTTYTVTSADDPVDPPTSGLTLRQAVDLANAHPGLDVITFGQALNGATIRVTQGQLDLNDDVTIAPTGADNPVFVPTPKGAAAAPANQHIQLDAETDNRIFGIGSGVKVTIADLDLLDGHAPSEGDGGAIQNFGDLTLLRVLVAGSHAGNGFGTFNGFGDSGGNGGGIYNAGSLTVRDSAIINNTAGNGADGEDDFSFGGAGGDGGSGGGIYNHGVCVLVNTTLAVNDCGYAGDGGDSFFGSGGWGGNGGSGGGLYNDGNATVVHCSITDNVTGAGGIGGDGDPFGRFGADGAGGGLYNDGGTLSLANTLSADNDPGLDNADADGTSLTSLGHNLIAATNPTAGWLASDQTGTTFAPIDARLGTLDYHGGQTPTLALLAGSPAIDKADVALNAPYNISVDARGYVRKYGPAADVGAYEFNSAFAGDANRDDRVDFNDLVALAQNYNTTGGKTWAQGDFTFDGNVDFNDLVILAQNYNRSLTSTAPAAAPAAAPVTLATLRKDPTFASLLSRDTKPVTATVFSVKPVPKPTAKPAPKHR